MLFVPTDSQALLTFYVNVTCMYVFLPTCIYAVTLTNKLF